MGFRRLGEPLLRRGIPERYRLGQRKTAGGLSVIVSDSFTDVDTTALTAHVPEIKPTGSVWTALSGTMTIQSNRAQWATVNPCIQWIETGKSDLTLSVIGNLPAAGHVGISFRVEGVNDWLFCAFNTTAVNIYKRNPGLVLVATVAKTHTLGVDYLLQLVLSGPDMIVTENGVVVLTASDSHNQTVTKHGLYTDNSVAAKLDDFLARA